MPWGFNETPTQSFDFSTISDEEKKRLARERLPFKRWRLTVPLIGGGDKFIYRWNEDFIYLIRYAMAADSTERMSSDEKALWNELVEFESNTLGIAPAGYTGATTKNAEGYSYAVKNLEIDYDVLADRPRLTPRQLLHNKALDDQLVKLIDEDIFIDTHRDIAWKNIEPVTMLRGTQTEFRVGLTVAGAFTSGENAPQVQPSRPTPFDRVIDYHSEANEYFLEPIRCVVNLKGFLDPCNRDNVIELAEIDIGSLVATSGTTPEGTFDEDNETYWLSSASDLDRHLTVDFDDEVFFRYYTMRAPTTGFEDMALEWRIEGWDVKHQVWSTVARPPIQSAWTAGETRQFTASGEYSGKLRFRILHISGLSLGSIKVYSERPEIEEVPVVNYDYFCHYSELLKSVMTISRTYSVWNDGDPVCMYSVLGAYKDPRLYDKVILTPEDKDIYVDTIESIDIYNLENAINAEISSTINMSLDYTGTATRGVDYTAPSSIEIGANTTFSNLLLNLIDNKNQSALDVIVTVTNIDDDNFREISMSRNSFVINLLSSYNTPSLDIEKPIRVKEGSEYTDFKLVLYDFLKVESEDVIIQLLYSGTAIKDTDYTAPNSVTILAGEAYSFFTVITELGTVGENIIITIGNIEKGSYDDIVVVVEEVDISIEESYKLVDLTAETMTSDVGETMSITVSSINNSGNEGFRSFNKFYETVGWFGDTKDYEWILLNFKEHNVSPTKITIFADDDYLDALPKSFRVLGSMDGIFWDTIFIVEDLPYWSNLEERSFDIPNELKFYRYLRLYLYLNQGRTTSSTLGSEIKVEGYEEHINYVRIFSLQNMSSNTSGDVTVSASSIYSSNNDAHDAFNNVSTSKWAAASGHEVAWLRFENAVKSYYVSKYIIRGRNNYISEMCKNWTFEGSKNGVDWDILDTQVDQVFSEYEYKGYDVVTNEFYNHFRVNITANNGGSQSSIGALNIYGYERRLYFDIDVDSNGNDWTLTGMTVLTTSSRASSATITPYYGTYMFRGEGVESCNGYIDIDVSGSASEIDNENAIITLNGAIAADYSDADYGRFELIFLDYQDNEINRLIGVNYSPTEGQSNWTTTELEGIVPVETRKVRVYLFGSRAQGTNLSIFWDIEDIQLNFIN